jgi:short subunit dehydrogenase-like uncharacterized protein
MSSSLTRGGRLFDIVVWGGGGFTGRLIVEYLCRAVVREHPTLRWAIAARDRAKAEAVKEWAMARAGPLPAGAQAPAVLVGDATDQASVDRIVGETRVVLAAAGPFWSHGAPVVDACVRLGADYVDIAGETPWFATLVRRFHAAAAGVRVVPACGFDSAPSDLGTLHALLQLRARTASPAADVRCYVAMNGRLSGGTMATGILMDSLGAEVAAQRADPFLVGGRPRGRAAPGPRARELDPTAAEYDAAIGGWVGPFMMAQINTRIVRRTAELLREAAPGALHAGMHGADFCYSEVSVAKDEAVAAALARGLPPVGKRLEMVSRGKLPKPGEGPSEDVRAGSWFTFGFVATAEDGTRVASTVRGGDPGYTETAKMAAEAALCLSLPECRERLPATGAGATGGVLTAASAFGSLLIERLHARGIRFEVEREPPTAEALMRPPSAPLASKL